MQQYDEGSLQVVDSQDVLTMALGTPEHSGQGGACKLAIECKENIVATGTIIEYKSSNCLVSIEVVFDRDADLPIADDDESLVKVNDAVGHHVFWPKNLVIHTPKGGKFENVECNTHKISKIQQIVKIPPNLKAFATLVDRCVTHSMDIVIKNDCDMFGYKCSTHISLDDCRHILSMVEIGVACLNVYIRLLYDELKEDEMAGQFGFINPASVSLSIGLANSERSIEKSRMVTKGLENASQSRYVFIPYNPRELLLADLNLRRILKISRKFIHAARRALFRESEVAVNFREFLSSAPLVPSRGYFSHKRNLLKSQEGKEKQQHRSSTTKHKEASKSQTKGQTTAPPKKNATSRNRDNKARQSKTEHPNPSTETPSNKPQYHKT
ncbi:hypothetical protein LWI29_033916 [Acer saccharum]|uniref:Transposase Tnp1/En/Spm-like domain-containing protein n=1 Tax=Acer saccharum TaxID=4024 RepID=A0AA39W9H1_ACESA|nr:hypothetical protein LWI29_033916 [Acer saccharum]